MSRLPNPAEITDTATAKVAVFAMERAGLLWHLDDSVANDEGGCDIIDYKTKEPIFTLAEIPVAQELQSALWEHIEDPHATCLAACKVMHPEDYDWVLDPADAPSQEEAEAVLATTGCPVLRAEAAALLAVGLTSEAVAAYWAPKNDDGTAYCKNCLETLEDDQESHCCP